MYWYKRGLRKCMRGDHHPIPWLLKSDHESLDYVVCRRCHAHVPKLSRHKAMDLVAKERAWREGQKNRV